MPLRLTVAVGPVDELLLIVTLPDARTAVVGLNATLNDAVWPGFKVMGKASPGRLKPVPVAVAELTVTAAVPAELSMTDCVAVVLRVISPNAIVLALMFSVGTPAFS